MAETSTLPIIPEGALISVTSREDGSLCSWGTYRAVREIDPAVAAAAWKAGNAGHSRPSQFREDRFLIWLVESGAIAPVPTLDWMLAADGDTDEMWVGASGRLTTAP